MQTEINQLKQELRWMRMATLACLLLTASMFIFSFQRNQDHDIIRARGIVIVDSAGRDRILIGAPLPPSRYRVRTDTAQVRRHWAGSYPDPAAFMQWYAGYQHDASGIVVLNEQGFDKVLIGDGLPDPNTGKRMVDHSGMLWNDDLGYERGGIGVGRLKEGGLYRNVVGLDDATTGEALHMVVMEDGTRALRFAGNEGTLLVGMGGKKSLLFPGKESFSGMRYQNPEGRLLWEQRLPFSKKQSAVH